MEQQEGKAEAMSMSGAMRPATWALGPGLSMDLKCCCIDMHLIIAFKEYVD